MPKAKKKAVKKKSPAKKSPSKKRRAAAPRAADPLRAKVTCDGHSVAELIVDGVGKAIAAQNNRLISVNERLLDRIESRVAHIEQDRNFLNQMVDQVREALTMKDEEAQYRKHQQRVLDEYRDKLEAARNEIAQLRSSTVAVGGQGGKGGSAIVVAAEKPARRRGRPKMQLIEVPDDRDTAEPQPEPALPLVGGTGFDHSRINAALEGRRVDEENALPENDPIDFEEEELYG